GLERLNFCCGRPFASAHNGAGMAHPAAGRGCRTGDETGNRLFAMDPDPFSRFLFCRTADFADHDDPVGIRIAREHFDHVQVGSSIYGIASDPHTSRLANSATGELPNRFISQRAAARDDADMTFFVNITGSNPNAATALRSVALSWRNDARTVRS